MDEDVAAIRAGDEAVAPIAEPRHDAAEALRMRGALAGSGPGDAAARSQDVCRAWALWPWLRAVSSTTMRSLSGVLVLASLGGIARAAPVPPPPFVASMTAQVCDSLTWSRITAETWFAYCVVRDKDPEAAQVAAASHNGFVFHHAVGAPMFTRTTMFQLSSQHAIRGSDVDADVSVQVKGATLRVSSNGYSGEVLIDVWNLGVFPPRLILETYGGGAEWSKADAPAAPRCTMDLVERLDRCTWTAPRCAVDDRDGGSPWDGDDVAFRTVPVLAFLASRSGVPRDPFACAARYGNSADDVYFGKNPKHTTFEAVADMDDTHGAARLTLYLRAHDATTALATRSGAWQGADHWEIWLSRAGNVRADWRDDQPGYCAARTREYLQLVVAPHPDGTVEIANGSPKTKSVLNGAAARVGASGAVVVDLVGTLANWAAYGGLTVSYSDSLDGVKQNTLISSSRVAWGKPASFGRLGRDALCRSTPSEAATSLPWQ